MDNELLNYVVALERIYGVFTADDLTKIWNKYNRSKIDSDYVYRLMDGLGDREKGFWWNPPYIVSNYFSDIKEYESFLNTRIKEDYYIPPEREIRYFMDKDFNLKDKDYKTLLDYFRNQKSLSGNQADELVQKMKISCTLNTPVKNIIEVLRSHKIKIKDIGELDRLIKTYMKLSMNTRKWHLKGFKPIELSNGKLKGNLIYLEDHQ